ncbi:HAD-IIB family hydrolase [Leptolyngbya sp. PCC 6406]|uniref:HAD-IIB family hydrolase n=1 Tax=Leptolyngbya sp. PCC 6406 TaxID=1173264 RepID=UPI0002ACC82F|nr:HAD-IIB family hydrolase [Leptolyngbya sp. PCC 6406]
MTTLLFFTDLDGTLLNTETYSYQAALPVLATLKQQGIPVIPVTSKTRAEVETLIHTIGLDGPFVVENGSAVFIPRETCPFPLPEGEDDGPYRVLQLGVAYVMARAGLKAIAQEIGRPLKGFGDLAVEQVQQLTGLAETDAKQAKMREFSEPFLTPKNVDSEKLTAAVEAMGFRVVVGDRFSHLIGAAAGKGAAVHQLAALYGGLLSPGQALTTVGLGNSPNDIDMLENTDIAIVLPGEDGPHPRLCDRGWRIAPQPAPEGWATAVQAVLVETEPG